MIPTLHSSDLTHSVATGETVLAAEEPFALVENTEFCNMTHFVFAEEKEEKTFKLSTGFPIVGWENQWGLVFNDSM